MNARIVLAAVVLAAWAAPMPAAEEPAPADYAHVADKLAPSLVRVEYTLKPDKGEDPTANGYTRASCPVRLFDAFNASTPVREERPMEVEGFLVAPDLVVSPDPMIHPRFVESVAVRFGDAVVPAKAVRFARDSNAVFLKTEKPLPGAQPLAFDPAAAEPYLVVTYGYAEDGWTTDVGSLGSAVAVSETGRKVRRAPLACLLVSEAGVPVGMSFSGRLAADDSWKGSPLDWPALSADELQALCDKVASVADRAVLRVQLGFRSPKKDQGSQSYSSRDEDSATERHVAGLLLGPREVLVLENLDQKATARLERIQVFPAEGEPVQATFAGTLKDYGAFVATLQQPLDGAVAGADGDIRRFDRALLVGADVRIQGENRVSYFSPRRIPEFDQGWKRHIYPQLPGSDESVFLFDADGRLVAYPIARRPKPGQQERWSTERPVLTAAAQLAPVLAALADSCDPHNVPLSEEEENRIAWMGVLLQPMNRELARANGVSHLTQDGETGAIVSYVYSGSPADQAGVQAGWILLRLHVADYPKPIEVTLQYDRSADWEFPWDRLDELSEEYYDRIPMPWPAVETPFTRMITDIGFGKTYQAEFVALRPAQGDPEPFDHAHGPEPVEGHGRGVAAGQTVMKDFEVVQSPTHFGTAAKFKSDPLGLTVRDMTYEVRRYLQKADEDPGVVVSKVEPGSKASVAGVKPYETVTHVNDQPVMTVKDFERLIAGQTELRLSVKRMVQGRVVKITLGPPAAPEGASPATEPVAAPSETPSGEGAAP